jgi:hypothetical protein
MKEKFSLLAYLSSLQDTRWAKKALNQQLIWLNRDKRKPDWAKQKTPAYWLQQVVIMARHLQIPENIFLNEETGPTGAGGFEVRRAMIRDFNFRKTVQVDRRDYLRWYRDKNVPKIDLSIYKWDGSYFWWEMKTGVLAEKFDDRFDFKAGIDQATRDKIIHNRICPLCDKPDTIEHALWICSAVKSKNKERKVAIPDQYIKRLTRELPFIEDLNNMSVHEAFLAILWLLNADQPDQLKRDIGSWFRRTLESRRELIQLQLKNKP